VGGLFVRPLDGLRRAGNVDRFVHAPLLARLAPAGRAAFRLMSALGGKQTLLGRTGMRKF
jgi:hypothetical protein